MIVVLVKETEIELMLAIQVCSKKIFLIPRSTKLVIIERLLLLAERYVITIEVSLSSL